MNDRLRLFHRSIAQRKRQKLAELTRTRHPGGMGYPRN
jgi:hypothetical protein